MTFGAKSWDGGGTVLFDSDTAVGGVVLDVITLGTGGSGTFTYPALAGRSVKVQLVRANWQINAKPSAPDFGVTTDTSLGWPRVTCAARSFPRVVLVWADL